MARRSVVGEMKRKLKSKVTNSAKQTLYMGIWKETVPVGKKRI